MGQEVKPETLDEFRSRIAAQLDAHFAGFARAIKAINAGFATANRKECT